MSEGGMEGQQKLSPRERAIQYIREKDAVRAERLRIGGIGRTGRAEAEVSAAAAFERVLDRLDNKAQRESFEGLRPIAYDLARAYGYVGPIGDILLGGAFIFGRGPRNIGLLTDQWFGVQLGRVLGVGATWRFRPVTWVAARAADIGGAVASEGVGISTTIMNNIIGRKPDASPAQA